MSPYPGNGGDMAEAVLSFQGAEGPAERITKNGRTLLINVVHFARLDELSL